MSEGIKDKLARFTWAVKTTGSETCMIQADHVSILDGGCIKFILHQDHFPVVAALKEYEYFFIAGVNE